MPWKIRAGRKIARVQRHNPTKDSNGYEYLVVAPDGRTAVCGYGDDGKNLADMIVQGMNEAADLHIRD